MYAGAEPPRYQRRMAFDRGNLATPPGLDYRDGKTKNQCVNRFQDFFLSELVMHYKDHSLEFGPVELFYGTRQKTETRELRNRCNQVTPEFSGDDFSPPLKF